MYQYEIDSYKQDIIKNGGFDGVNVSGSFSGIQILGVRKIENSRGMHCAFVDLETYRGNDYYCVVNSATRFGFSKPENEVAAHCDIYGDNNSLRIFGSNPLLYSQTIGGLSYSHKIYGHSSYYIYAVKTNSQGVTPPVIGEAQKTIAEIETLFQKLKGLVK